MGPPLFSGGNAAKDAPDTLQVFVLQWGRRFSAAEMVGGYLDASGADTLQWGRRFSAAEIG